MKSCLNCNSTKEGKVIRSECDFVCSTCTRKLMHADPDVLKSIYKTAVEKRDRRKATAVSIFMAEKPRDFVKMADASA